MGGGLSLLNRVGSYAGRGAGIPLQEVSYYTECAREDTILIGWRHHFICPTQRSPTIAALPPSFLQLFFVSCCCIDACYSIPHHTNRVTVYMPLPGRNHTLRSGERVVGALPQMVAVLLEVAQSALAPADSTPPLVRALAGRCC